MTATGLARFQFGEFVRVQKNGQRLDESRVSECEFVWNLDQITPGHDSVLAEGAGEVLAHECAFRGQIVSARTREFALRLYHEGLYRDFRADRQIVHVGAEFCDFSAGLVP